MSDHELTGICSTCKLCDGSICTEITQEGLMPLDYPEKFPETYPGARFTSDAMDCALPIAIDSHSGCSYNCLYCFSNNLQRAPDRNKALVQRAVKNGSFYSQFSIDRLERFLARENKDRISLAMYDVMDAGTPVQFGALGDPFDELERHSGWAKKAIPLFIKYGIPVRIGTKGGTVLNQPEYLKLFEKSPDQFWFAFSIISNSDELISKIDLKAPNTSERLAAMKSLTDLGCKASLRFRPFLPGVSDCYPGEPEAWKVLMNRANEAGASAISFEWIFLATGINERQLMMERAMNKVLGNTQFSKQ